MFYPRHGTALMWGCRSGSLRNRLAKAVTCYISEKHINQLFGGIDESINGTGLLKRNCKKMPVPFRHWHFISIQGKIDTYSCKAQKERKVRLYEVTQVFRMGNGILFVMTMITGYKRQ